jgi:iron(III) transport system substrate-binding protein
MRIGFIGLALLLQLGPVAAPAQSAETTAQREARLLPLAKAEGEVAVYSTAPPEDNKAITDAFEARYGVPVKLWRGKSEDILQRTLQEASAGQRLVDALVNTGEGLESTQREGLLQKIESPWRDTLIPEASPAHGEWIGFYLAPMVQFYNTNLVRKSELPKAWADLADPKWKGKLGVESADSDWLQQVVDTLGREKGLAIFADIAKNRVSVRRGHSLLANLVTAGEVPFALTAYQFTTEQIRASGAPVDWYTIGPAISPQVGVGLAKQPPHPNAAALFADFVAGPGQDVLAKRAFVASRKDIFAKAGFPMKVEDAATAAAVVDGEAEWDATFKRLFGGK